MGLYSVLGSALSGMHTTQAGLDLVARNVANADVPGYTRKLLGTTPIIADDKIFGVRAGEITRQLDSLLQRQLRGETSATGYVDTMSRYFGQVDMLFGEPGGAAGVDTLYNKFENSFEALVATPDSFTARDQVLRDAQALAQTINQMSSSLQSMRLETERDLGNAVQRVNELVQQIAKVNQQIGAKTGTGEPPADLLDVRDRYISELSSYVDINVTERQDGSVAISTTGGATLLDLKPSELVFDQRGTLTPQSLYSTDPQESGVGTIKLKSPNGLDIDLIQDRAIRSGEIAALLEMRDTHLVQAQAQLDALAASMAKALSSSEVAGEAVTAGAQAGFDVDLSDMLPGDTMSLTFTDNGVERRVTIVRVDDPGSLPLDGGATPDPNDEVIGIDFSGGYANAAAAIQAALGGGVEVSDQGGGTLRFLDDGSGNVSIGSAEATVTSTSFTEGLGIPFFVDGNTNAAFSGSLDGVPQQLGFAQRIKVNPALLADNTQLVRYAADTQMGDQARPQELLRRLKDEDRLYAPSLGVAGTTPYKGTVGDYVQRIVAHQGAKVADVGRTKDAQDVITAQLQERFTATSGVNLDEEMAHLIELQTAYQANTRVIQTFREMVTMLLQL